MATASDALPVSGTIGQPKRPLRLPWPAWLVALAVSILLVMAASAAADRVRRSGWTTIIESPSDTGYYFPRYLAVDQQGAIWATIPNGVGRLGADGQWTAYSYYDAVQYVGEPAAFAIDGQGRLWVCGLGLSVLDGDGHWTTYTPENSGLADGNAEALAIDGAGTVWVGTWSGLSVLSPDGQWTTFTTANSGLANDRVNALAADPQGRIWVGTQAGLSVLAPAGGWTTYTASNSGLADNTVLAITPDEHGQVWVATMAGLSLLSPDGQWTTYTPVPNADFNRVWAAVVDDDGWLWVGSDAGLSALDPNGNWTTYTSANSGLQAGDTGVFDLVLDPQGQLWLGTNTGLMTVQRTALVAPRFIQVLSGLRVASMALLAVVLLALGYQGVRRFQQEARAAPTPLKLSRFPPARLATISLTAVVLGPLLYYGIGILAVMWIMDDSGDLHRVLPWLGVFIFVLALAMLLLPLVALVTGLLAFRGMQWRSQAVGRLAALVAIVLAVLEIVGLVVPTVVSMVPSLSGG